MTDSVELNAAAGRAIWRWEKLLIEAPVNGGRNYNGPKVAKFLVG